MHALNLSIIALFTASLSAVNSLHHSIFPLLRGSANSVILCSRTTCYESFLLIIDRVFIFRFPHANDTLEAEPVLHSVCCMLCRCKVFTNTIPQFFLSWKLFNNLMKCKICRVNPKILHFVKLNYLIRHYH